MAGRAVPNICRELAGKPPLPEEERIRALLNRPF